jgi:UDP-glucose 4-epimerase
VLATAVARLLGIEPDIQVIGIRHGEKVYETLATREELSRANDQGDFYRVPVDARDLNYGEYFDEGDLAEGDIDDYNSHNTERLDVDQVVSLLDHLPEFQTLTRAAVP